MTDKLISFETAKLAKEKGFNIPVNGVYVDNGTLSFARDNDETDYNWNKRKGYSAPTQSLLQKWLREQYGIHILIRITIYDTFTGWILNPMFRNGSAERVIKTKGFKTYEEALEVGLQEALKLITNPA